MPRYYGPGFSTTEKDAIRQIDLEETGKKKKPRTQVWQAPEDPKESFLNYLKQKEDGNEGSDP